MVLIKFKDIPKHFENSEYYKALLTQITTEDDEVYVPCEYIENDSTIKDIPKLKKMIEVFKFWDSNDGWEYLISLIEHNVSMIEGFIGLDKHAKVKCVLFEILNSRKCKIKNFKKF